MSTTINIYGTYLIQIDDDSGKLTIKSTESDAVDMAHFLHAVSAYIIHLEEAVKVLEKRENEYREKLGLPDNPPALEERKKRSSRRSRERGKLPG
jgi:hypothetical protein